ncbi:MAG: phage shock protein operon transcriptional activator [Desulfobacteraceae bacterium]|nr:phage shock protein operon transcriptional activator [Desulfobacteraceae bacterium]
MEALGQSEAFLDFQDRLSRVARVDRPVLLVGERGTGKELAAVRMHYLSLRWKGPMVTLNCAALQPSLMEAELFGHERGAFTGAVARRTGRFETADGGTLFLDEIGNTPLEVQEKILRVVEYGSFERVGSTRPVWVDVRIVAATNADLVKQARKGRFKRDLLDRLSFEVLFLPPLRERVGDVQLLAEHFARRMALELRREEPPLFTADTVAELERYDWPGNVRELKNVVERAVCRSEGPLIREVEIDPFGYPYGKRPQKETPQEPEGPEALSPKNGLPDWRTLPLKEAIQELEIRRIQDALKAARFNQKQAAEMLGLTYHQFRGLYRKYADAIK